MKRIGFTLDSIDNYQAIAKQLATLPEKPIIRVVIDPGTTPEDYLDALKALKPVAVIMAELLDSSDMKGFSADAYRVRAKNYYDALKYNVDLWEIGNEINGDWLGPNAGYRAFQAHQYIHGAGGDTALTLYWTPDEAWERWALDNIPYLMGSTLTVVTMSVYEDDNENKAPDWDSLFERMGRIFPSSRLMVGEFGPGESRFRHTTTKDRMAMCKKYWTREISHERYDGAIYWWGAQEESANPDEFLKTMKEVMP
jgi:hypothetical protein